MPISQTLSTLSICAAATVALGGCQKFPLRDGPELESQRCERVGNGSIIGPEDIAAEPGAIVAYISATDRWSLNQYLKLDPGTDAPAAGIFRYRPDSGELLKLEVLHGDIDSDLLRPDGFFPHGIDLFRASPEHLYLYAVNHPVDVGRTSCKRRQSNAVALFRVTDHGALEVKAYRRFDPLAFGLAEGGSLNDVVAVDERRFYVSYNPAPFHGKGAVFYFDGERYSEALGGIRFANGLALNPGGDHLFVADSMAGTVRAFRHPPEKTGLQPSQDFPEIRLCGVPDNLTLDQDDKTGTYRLLVAIHGSKLRFLLHALFKMKSPSEVVAIPLEQGFPSPGERLFVDRDGSRNSGTSAAARVGPHLLLGNVFEHGFLKCRSD